MHNTRKWIMKAVRKTHSCSLPSLGRQKTKPCWNSYPLFRNDSFLLAKVDTLETTITYTPRVRSRSVFVYAGNPFEGKFTNHQLRSSLSEIAPSLYKAQRHAQVVQRPSLLYSKPRLPAFVILFSAMTSTGEGDPPVVEQPAEESKPVTREKRPRAPKEKKPTAPEEKKPKPAKTVSHPPYFQMIKEALLALNDKGGSSPYAIAKYMEEKHKSVLPANFRKILGLQLKNQAARGKLVKIKASYKLSSEAGKKDTDDTRKVTRSTAQKNQRPKRSVAKKTETAKKVGKTAKKTKKTKKSSTPAKPKQPKSLKSPSKKARKAIASAS